MARPAAAAKTLDEIAAWRRDCSDINLRSTFIVGYPGESEALFEETYQLLLELPFAYFHVFSYSDRDHAKSSRLDDALKVPKAEIARRSLRLRELSNRKRQVYHQQFIGNVEPVLFEQHKGGYWSGVTDTYIRVKVRSERDIRNQLLPVRLERLEQQVMIGSLADSH